MTEHITNTELTLAFKMVLLSVFFFLSYLRTRYIKMLKFYLRRNLTMKLCTLIKEVHQVFSVQVFENQIICNFQKENLSNQGSFPSGSVISKYKCRL